MGVQTSAAGARRLAQHQGEHKRSLALYGNFIIFVSFDNIVVGLDARTGQRMWQQARGGDGYVTNSSACSSPTAW